MAWVAVGVTAASVGLTLIGGQQGKKAAILEGQQRKAADVFEANALQTNATQAVAVAQRNMIDAQRVSALAASRATALAAASGGGATSPTALKVVADISREGSYNAAKALYQGEEAARTMRLQAFEKIQQGEFDQQAGEMKGKAIELQSFGTVLNTAGNFYGIQTRPGGLLAKYGDRGPVQPGNSASAIDWSMSGTDV